jgi:hypothetical protein
MHRSGTSMIAGLLNQTGVYLGSDGEFLPPATDNPAGFWEHGGFYSLNERLLLYLGAGWDFPDLPDGWASRQDLSPFREAAGHLIERMRTSAESKVAWGWKDPRNSITIQFWKTLLPELRVVVCVRNPLAVAGSLQRRNGISFAASCQLWLRHYQNLLRNVSPQDRVVTLYERYFTDAHAELTRVLGELGLPADDEAIAFTRNAVDPALHHQHATLAQLLASDCHPDIIEMYVHLSAEAGVTGQAGPEAAATAGLDMLTPGASALGDLQRSRFHAEIAQREEYTRHLIHENASLRELLEETRAQLGTLAREVRNERCGREAQARRLSAIAETAAGLHRLIEYRYLELSRLQRNVERPLKDAAPVASRLLGHSGTADSLYRLLKRIRRLGTFLMLQRDVNDAAVESLGLLAEIAAVIGGPGAGKPE